jgi:hypothetical protein
MKKLVILLSLALLAGLVWTRQHARRQAIEKQNGRLTIIAEELAQRVERSAAARQSAEQRLAELRAELAAREAAAASKQTSALALPSPTVEPDPARQGGWPAGASYIYLPKSFLTNVSCRFWDGERLTEEAGSLLGLTVAEREKVSQAFSDLIGQFRRLEVERMESVAPPSEWAPSPLPGAPAGNGFDAALAYRIPSLAPDLESARGLFSQELQRSLGPFRAQLVEEATTSQLRRRLDDLGAGERIVAFLWQPERDGRHSLWYGIADSRQGTGARFFRVETGEQMAPNSQVAYYARLFGVKLPGQ